MVNDLALIGTLLYGEREVRPSNLQEIRYLSHSLTWGALIAKQHILDEHCPRQLSQHVAPKERARRKANIGLNSFIKIYSWYP